MSFIIKKLYSSFLCGKYERETKKIRKLIEKIESENRIQTENINFLQELLDSDDRRTKVAAAYFIIRKFTGKQLFDVQIMAVLALLDGCFTDVKTGEGKTIIIGAYCLVADKPIHVVTVNNFLAEEAIRQLGKMYSAFGFSYDVLTEENFMDGFDMKKDIIYGTAAAFAFKYIVKRFQRDIDYELNTAIIDEADYILIDNATSAFVVGIDDDALNNQEQEKRSCLIKFVEKVMLIFSNAKVMYLNYDEIENWGNLENNLTNTIFLNKSLKFVDFTQDIYDYIYEISKDYELEPSEALAFMFGIINAYYLLEENVDYIVTDDNIMLVDRHNGRLLPNTKHDIYIDLSLSLKESLDKVEQSKCIGRIANQVYFLKYNNVIGLSGSLIPVADEICEIFMSDVIEIPKNKPSDINKKYHFVTDKKEKLLEIVKSNIENDKATLIICKTDKNASEISSFLEKNGFENTLFNNSIEAAKEKQIVEDAGKAKKITVSTLLFGRGTDIIPQEDSTILSVIMYEEFGCKRANVQISGRTGRQGKPGDIHILVSPGDDIFDYVDCYTKENLNEKNYIDAIEKAISFIYFKNKEARTDSTYFAFYLDLIFESYYSQVKENGMDDYFLSQMENIELICRNIDKKEDTVKLVMKEAKKVIDTILYYTKK